MIGRAALVVCALAGTAAADLPELVRVGHEAEPPIASVVTFGQGDDIYERWGHAALCFAYPHSGRDPVCFNWGVTDFDDTSDLAWGFVRGRQRFWLDQERASTMVASYEDEDRDIYAQTLPLSPDQARELERDVLAQLSGPGREYVYDHFYDNCTTRVRDVVDRAVHGALHANTDTPYDRTLREMAAQGIAAYASLRALSDFVVGRAVDRYPTVWQAMFHPDVLRAQIAERLGAKPVVVHVRKGAPFPQTGAGAMWPVLGLIVLFALPLAIARRRWTIAWATVWLGGWGIVLWTAVLLTDIPALRWNEAALVLVPLDLALPILSAARRERYARWRVLELLAISALCAIGVLRQPLWLPVLSAIVPLSLIARPSR